MRDGTVTCRASRDLRVAVSQRLSMAARLVIGDLIRMALDANRFGRPRSIHLRVDIL